MKNRRRHLGSTYTSYPAQAAAEFLGDKLYKLIASIICCALWTGVYYIAIAVINFNRANFLQGAKEYSTQELFMTEGSLLALLGCYLVIVIFVFRSRMGEKVNVKKTERPR